VSVCDGRSARAAGMGCAGFSSRQPAVVLGAGEPACETPPHRDRGLIVVVAAVQVSLLCGVWVWGPAPTSCSCWCAHSGKPRHSASRHTHTHTHTHAPPPSLLLSCVPAAAAACAAVAANCGFAHILVAHHHMRASTALPANKRTHGSCPPVCAAEGPSRCPCVTDSVMWSVGTSVI
jgi:hypothetical protein